MSKLKITTWNAEWMEHIFDKNTIDVLSSYDKSGEKINNVDTWAKRKASLIKKVGPDLIGIEEGPTLLEQMKEFVNRYLSDNNGNPLYKVYRTSNGPSFGNIYDRQYIYLLVSNQLSVEVAPLTEDQTVMDLLYSKWPVNYWGIVKEEQHEFWRRPLVAEIKLKTDKSLRVIIGHTKSPFTRLSQSDFDKDKENYIQEAMKSRIKLSTEAWKIRQYVDECFKQDPSMAVIVMGDMNDGPGRRYFEKLFLFQDMVNVLMGSMMEPEKFMTHAFVKYPPDQRYTTEFTSFLDPDVSPKVLLDHMLVSPGMIKPHDSVKFKKDSEKIEHEIYQNLLIENGKTIENRPSDHRPASIIVEY